MAQHIIRGTEGLHRTAHWCVHDIESGSTHLARLHYWCLHIFHMVWGGWLLTQTMHFVDCPFMHSIISICTQCCSSHTWCQLMDETRPFFHRMTFSMKTWPLVKIHVWNFWHIESHFDRMMYTREHFWKSFISIINLHLCMSVSYPDPELHSCRW